MHLDFQFLFKPELLWSTQFCLCPTTLFTPAAGPKKVRSALEVYFDEYSVQTVRGNIYKWKFSKSSSSQYLCLSQHK